MTDAGRGRAGGGSTGIDFPVVPSFIGTAVSGGCGCVAFLAGAVLAIALFGPQFLAVYGARVLERDLNRILDAEVDVDEVRLAWRGPQTAGRVRVLAPDGEPMLEGSLTLPSMFALFGGGGDRGAFGIRVDRLVARVDDEGRSDLARALRVEPDETLLSALRGRVAEFVRGRDLEPERRGDLRFDVRVADGRFVVPGGPDVRIEDLEFSVRSHRLGGVLQLSSFGVTAPGLMAGPARAELRATFDAEGRLVQASAGVDPIPAEVLRAIGWLPRAPDTRRPGPRGATLHGRAAAGLLDFAASLFEPGASVDFELGGRGPSPGAAGSGDRRLVLSVSGPAGAMVLRGRVRGAGADATLLPDPAADGFALEMTGAFPSETFAEFLRPLAPAGIEVEPAVADRGAGRFVADSRRLEVPLAAFADGVTPEALERLLRDARLDLDVSSTDTAARISRRGSSAPEDVLVVEHQRTSVELRPRGSASLLSTWRTPGLGGVFSTATLDVPAGPAPATLDLVLGGVPRSILVEASEMPAEVGALFAPRVHQLVVRGLPVATILRAGELVPAAGLRIEIRPTSDTTRPLVGTLRSDAFRCSAAAFDLSLANPAVRAMFLEDPMPWLAETRAPDGVDARVEVELRDLVVDLGDARGDREARVSLRCDPLEVRLHRGLLMAIGVGADASDRWIAWAPPRMEYVVNGGSIEFVDVDVPLEDEESARMSGDRNAAGGYTLGGEVERRLLTDSLVRRILDVGEGVDLETIGVEVIPVFLKAANRESVQLLFDPRVLELLLGPLGVDDGGDGNDGR